MKNLLIIILLHGAFLLQAQGTDSLYTHLVWKDTKKKCPVSELKECILVTENNSRLKNIKLIEVYFDRIVFIHEGSLHDMKAERIKKIYIGKDKMFLLRFSPEDGPYIETNYN